jgi:ribosomal protein L37E
VLHGDSAFAAQMLQSAFDDLVTWRKKYEPYTDIWSKFGDCFQSVVNQISEFEDEFKAQSLVTDTDGALARLIAWREECAAILANWAACREQVSYIMEAIAEAEELFGKLNTRSERKCMRCLKPFPSLNIGHRICSSCAQSADMSGMSEASVT